MILNSLSLKVTVLFSFFFYGNAYCQEAFPDCGTCYLAKKETCSTSCSTQNSQKDPAKIETCKRKCILQECNNFCGYNLDKKDSARTPDTVSCDYCTRNSVGNCEKKCEKTPTDSCIKICVSQSCKGSCSLPDQSKQIFSETKSTCETCQKNETDLCAQNCASGSGSIACKVACVERKCTDECLID